ncbi:MAG: four helix bundle protein [bacterium]
MAYHSFEDLEVWQRACQQCTSIYELFEDCKKFSLKDQIERASLSVPSNIAEGHERSSRADFQRFLTIALGSNAELHTQLYIARKLTLIDQSTFKTSLHESKEISAMIRGLWKATARKTTTEN